MCRENPFFLVVRLSLLSAGSGPRSIHVHLVGCQSRLSNVETSLLKHQDPLNQGLSKGVLVCGKDMGNEEGKCSCFEPRKAAKALFGSGEPCQLALISAIA